MKKTIRNAFAGGIIGFISAIIYHRFIRKGAWEDALWYGGIFAISFILVWLVLGYFSYMKTRKNSERNQ